MQAPAHQSHSASIDGLRSVAVLPVLIGHAFPKILPGGFVGVDIFFVISGFLIASMIADKSLRDSFSTTDFYKRRILRIMPALAMVLFITTISAFILLPPYQLREFGQALFGSSIFSSNILFWLKSGYFDAAAEANPLVHTWSLAVEEQFYVVAPLMAFLVAKSRKAFYVVLAFVGLGSLAFAEATNNVVPSTYFFFTLNRIFELIVGCLVGCAFHSRQMGELTYRVDRLPAIASNLLSAAAIAALFWCFFTFGSWSHHPGLITLIPVCATGVLLALHTSNSVVHRLLALRPLVFVGLISYSLYLVHQPLLALARTVTFGDPSTELLSALLIVSIILAYLIWRFVEQPFRNYDRFSLKQTFAGCAAIIAIGSLAGLALHVSQGLPSRYSEETRALVRPAPIELDQLDASGLPQGSRLVLWGDSHARMLYPAAQKWMKQTKGEVRLFDNGGCPPIVGFDNDWRNSTGPVCSEFNQEALNRLLEMKPGLLVVLASRWPNYLRAPDELDEFGHPWTLASRSIFPSAQKAWREDATEQATASLGSVISALTQAGHRVVLVGTVPNQKVHADNLGFLTNGEISAISEIAVAERTHNAASAKANGMLTDAVAGLAGVTVIDPAELYCRNGKCSYLYDGKFAYADSNHLNEWGSIPLVRRILEQSAQSSASAR
ncbi:acyltransferase family protein [Altererythrobacter luteolus]|uniref:Acyltransferase family protein n=1 Tax=Pontixanthobacter luteolus TaxID=295089 RepID=A0A6I4V7R0_9SPHN|nr:acyltransferase family protein [Pontixanthobacter luteolus]MXP47942.1 acyltransferase family protein [Pontixanthobacter luteolus]